MRPTLLLRRYSDDSRSNLIDVLTTDGVMRRRWARRSIGWPDIPSEFCNSLNACSLEVRSPPLYLWANGRILRVQTSLSARYSVSEPVGGEMSGLTAHFL